MNLRKLLSAILVASLVFGLVSTAMADSFTPGSAFDAAQKMADLGLVRGRAPGDFALNETITRAEMVTILVRALGRENDAAILAGAPAFSDSQSHWASGYVALAKNAGITNGYPDGTFKPDGQVTAAEAVAFLVKFLGLPVNESLGWPNSFLAASLEAGFVTTDDNVAAYADTAAPRGMVFFFGDKAFSSVKLASSGKTVYQTYVDTEAPVVSVDDVAKVTSATSVTVTGKVSGHSVLHVGLSSATWSAVTPNADGTFSASVALEAGENSILVHALDAVGNETLKTIAVTRELGAAAAITAPASVSVVAGAEAEVAAEVKDANGAVITGATVEGTSTLGTYADGKFTAGTKAGTGTLTLKSGDAVAEVAVTVTAGALAKVSASAESVAPGGAVTLTATDEHGNAISGATFSVDSADALVGSNGVFIASKAGNYVVTASVGGATATITVGVHGAVAKFTVTTSREQVVANQSQTVDVTIKAVDANGNLVANASHTVAWDGATTAYFEGRDPKDLVWLTGAINNTTLSGGTATVRLRTQAVPGNQIVTLKVSDTAVGSTLTGNSTIELVDQVATSLKISTSNSQIANNNGNENNVVTVDVLDQTGAVMLAGAWDVTVKVTGPADLVDDRADNASATSKTGSAGATAMTTYLKSKQFQSGVITVTASNDLLGTASATVTSVTAGPAAALTLTKSAADGIANGQRKVTFTAQVTDANGVPVETPTPPADVRARFTVAEGNLNNVTYERYTSAVSTAFVTDVPTFATDNKTATLTNLQFTDWGAAGLRIDAAAFIGDVTLTLTDLATSNKLTGNNVTATFVADTPTTVDLTRNVVAVSATNPVVSVSAQLYDAAGNKASGARKLTFTATGGNAGDVTINGTKETVDVWTDESGKATVEIKVLGYVGEVYNVEVDGAAGSSIAAGVDNSVAISPSNAVASSVNVTIRDNTLPGPQNILTSVDAGDTVLLRAIVRDANGKGLTGQAADLSIKVVEGKLNATPGAWTEVDAINQPGVYENTFVASKSGRLVLEVTNDSSPTAVKGTASASVRAGSYVKYVVQREDLTVATASVTKGTATMIRLIPVDAFGNLAPATTQRTIDFDADELAYDAASEYFELRSSASGANLLDAAGFKSFTMTAGSTGMTLYVLSNVDVQAVIADGVDTETVTFTAE